MDVPRIVPHLDCDRHLHVGVQVLLHVALVHLAEGALAQRPEGEREGDVIIPGSES